MAYSEIGGESLVEDTLRDQMYARADMDFLITAVRRLLRAAEHAKNSGCDINGELALPIRVFQSRWSQVTGVRDSLEHFDEWERRQLEGWVLPMRGGGNVAFLWRGGNVDARELFKSAEKLYRVVCDVIASLESQTTSPVSSEN
jgi:hypothetical protein